MTPARLLDSLAAHRRRYVHARRAARAGEEAASFDLALSTRLFSRRTKSAVEDKLSLSATLVRAGEVDAANRLFEDLERDVRDHEAALIERVNEVRCAQGARRERVTSLRVVRALASAVASACMLSMSLLGVAFAAWVADVGVPPAKHERAQRQEARARARDDGPARARNGRDARVKRVRIAGMTVELSPAELRTYRALIADGGADDGRLEAFLLSVLPADIAGTVTDALAGDGADAISGVVERARGGEQRARAEDGGAARSEPERGARAPAASDGDDGGGGEQPAGGGGGDDGGVDAGVDLLDDPGSLP